LSMVVKVYVSATAKPGALTRESVHVRTIKRTAMQKLVLILLSFLSITTDAAGRGTSSLVHRFCEP
jgi:hypothetical protein